LRRSIPIGWDRPKRTRLWDRARLSDAEVERLLSFQQKINAKGECTFPAFSQRERLPQGKTQLCGQRNLRSYET
jgi:hypothetical protein